MLFRLAWWGLNIYGVKKTFDLAKENLQLKQKSEDDQATIRTLARQVPLSDTECPPLPESQKSL